MTTAAAADTPILVPFADGWQTLERFVVRSAGFPADLLSRVISPGLYQEARSTAAGDLSQESFAARFDLASARGSSGLSELAADQRLREAIAWQNPVMLDRCVDKVAHGVPDNFRGRNRQLKVLGYLQRYCLKNYTIGFFGPVAWGRWTPDKRLITVDPGEGESTRTVYHECEAIDAIALALTDDPRCRRFAVARRLGKPGLRDGLLRRHSRPDLRLDEHEQAVFGAVDGVRSVSDIVRMTGGDADDASAVAYCWSVLERLIRLQVLVLDWAGPVETHPERRLRSRLERIDDPAVREDLTMRLGKYLDSAGALARAAGDADEVAGAMRELAATFRNLVGSPTAPSSSGRTRRGLAYEDVRSWAVIRAGNALRAGVAVPLGLTLTSASWLADRVAAEFSAVFDDAHQRLVASHGAQVPLPAMIDAVSPALFPGPGGVREPVRRALTEFEQRWLRVHRARDGGPDVRLDPGEAAARVAGEFGGKSAHPPWPMAYCHSPDLMIAAHDGVSPDDPVTYVLGELHLAMNTLESRVFVEQSDDRQWLVGAAEQLVPDGRICLVPDKNRPEVSSRLAPPSALMSPRFRYWTVGEACVEPPAPCFPAEALVVQRDARDGLVVHDEFRYFGSLMEVMGDLLSASIAHAFAVVPHTWRRAPRIQIGDLVVERRRWRFEPGELTWAFVRDPRARYIGFACWSLEAGLTAQTYHQRAGTQPQFCDASSPALVDLFAASVRSAAGREEGVVVTEAVPDTSQLWYPGSGRGTEHSCELRMVMTPAQP